MEAKLITTPHTAKKNMTQIQNELTVLDFTLNEGGLTLNYYYQGNDYHLFAPPVVFADLMEEAGYFLHYRRFGGHLFVKVEIAEDRLVPTPEGVSCERQVTGFYEIRWDVWLEKYALDAAIAKELAVRYEFSKRPLLFSL